MQTQLIASQLRNMGFSTAIRNGQVVVGLKARWLSMMEVETALEQAFGEVEFRLVRVDSQKVRIVE